MVLAFEGVDAAVRYVQELHRQGDYTLLQSRCWVEYDSLRAVPAVARILREVGVSDPLPRKP
jgi:hypothetical protein